MASFFDQVKAGKTTQNLDDLKATIARRKGLAPQNRFLVFLSFPTAARIESDIGGYLTSGLNSLFGIKKNESVKFDGRDTTILCESCSIPGKTINTIEYEHNGFRQAVKKPSGYTNEEITFTFHLTNDYYAKKIFDKWLNSCVNPESYLVPYDNEFKTDLIIQQLDQQDNVVYGVKCINAFPTNVSAIDLNQSSNDTTQRLSVTMTYEDLIPEGSFTNVLTKTKSFFGKVSDTLDSISSLRDKLGF